MAGIFPGAQALKDAEAVVAKYSPETAWEFIAHLGDFPGMAESLGRMCKTVGDKAATEFPVEPAVAELLYSMVPVCTRIAAAFEALKPGAERAQAREYANRGHKNGRMWNV